jgi:hypothetical protein
MYSNLVAHLKLVKLADRFVVEFDESEPNNDPNEPKKSSAPSDVRRIFNEARASQASQTNWVG